MINLNCTLFIHTTDKGLGPEAGNNYYHNFPNENGISHNPADLDNDDNDTTDLTDSVANSTTITSTNMSNGNNNLGNGPNGNNSTNGMGEGVGEEAIGTGTTMDYDEELIETFKVPPHCVPIRKDVRLVDWDVSKLSTLIIES